MFQSALLATLRPALSHPECVRWQNHMQHCQTRDEPKHDGLPRWGHTSLFFCPLLFPRHAAGARLDPATLLSCALSLCEQHVHISWCANLWKNLKHLSTTCQQNCCHEEDDLIPSLVMGHQDFDVSCNKIVSYLINTFVICSCKRPLRADIDSRYGHGF